MGRNERILKQGSVKGKPFEERVWRLAIEGIQQGKEFVELIVGTTK